MISRQKILKLVSAYDQLIATKVVKANKFSEDQLLPPADKFEALSHAKYILGEIPSLIPENRFSEISQKLGFVHGVLWTHGFITLERIPFDLTPDASGLADDVIFQLDMYRRSRFKIQRVAFRQASVGGYFREVLEILTAPPEKCGTVIYEFDRDAGHTFFEFQTLTDALQAFGETFNLDGLEFKKEITRKKGCLIGYGAKEKPPWFFALEHDRLEENFVQRLEVQPVE